MKQIRYFFLRQFITFPKFHFPIKAMSNPAVFETIVEHKYAVLWCDDTYNARSLRGPGGKIAPLVGFFHFGVNGLSLVSATPAGETTIKRIADECKGNAVTAGVFAMNVTPNKKDELFYLRMSIRTLDDIIMSISNYMVAPVWGEFVFCAEHGFFMKNAAVIEPHHQPMYLDNWPMRQSGSVTINYHHSRIDVIKQQQQQLVDVDMLTQRLQRVENALEVMGQRTQPDQNPVDTTDDVIRKTVAEMRRAEQGERDAIAEQERMAPKAKRPRGRPIGSKTKVHNATTKRAPATPAFHELFLGVPTPQTSPLRPSHPAHAPNAVFHPHALGQVAPYGMMISPPRSPPELDVNYPLQQFHDNNPSNNPSHFPSHFPSCVTSPSHHLHPPTVDTSSITGSNLGSPYNLASPVALDTSSVTDSNLPSPIHRTELSFMFRAMAVDAPALAAQRLHALSTQSFNNSHMSIVN